MAKRAVWIARNCSSTTLLAQKILSYSPFELEFLLLKNLYFLLDEANVMTGFSDLGLTFSVTGQTIVLLVGRGGDRRMISEKK